MSDIGYKNSPKHSRFEKGRSGNSAGRPKGSKNTLKLLDQVLEQKITITQDGKNVKITKKFGMLMQLANSAANGDIKAISALFPYMQRVMNGEKLRLIINIPPRYLKSIICSIAFPAFVLGHNPNAKIMCISYSEELASKLATDCRAIMQTKWYKEQFPKTVINPNRNSVMDFETTKHGVRYR